MLQTSSKRWDGRPIAFTRPAVFLSVLAATLLAGRAGLLTQTPLFCPFLALSGFPCPLCGITRAWQAMAAADFAAALSLHPFVFLIPPLVLGAAFGWRPGPRLFYALAASLSAFGIVRIAILTL
ncbi:MAG: DUF2752 domain-containing protein [Bryobacteraceae bacterium]